MLALYHLASWQIRLSDIPGGERIAAEIGNVDLPEANVAVLVTLRLDPVVIKLFLPLSAVALYAVAAKVSEYTFLLNKQFSNALMPLVSQLHGRGDHDAIRRIMTDGTRFLLALAVPGIGLLYYYAPEFIQLWLGAGFAGSADLLRILLLALIPATLQLNAANILGMTGQHRYLAIAMLVSAALNLLLSMALIAAFGLPGAALGTLAAVLLVEAAYAALFSPFPALVAPFR